MSYVHLRGFPAWTEDEDLKCVVEQTGPQPKEVTVRHVNSNNPMASLAVAEFGPGIDVHAVASQLNGFEFTPGYPLQATVTGHAYSGGRKDTRQRAAPAPAPASAPETGSEHSASNCIGAGRIEGWIIHESHIVKQKSWGHVQSYAFTGNVVFRAQRSPMMRNAEYKQNDSVTFEVLMVNGQCEAVKLALPGQDVPEPGADDDVEEYEDEGQEGEPGGLEQGEELAPVKPWEDQWEAALQSGVKSERTVGKGKSKDQYEDKRREWTKDEEWRGRPKSEREIQRSIEQQRKREQGDGRGVFFGGIGPEVTEDQLWTFAEWAGKVKQVRIFIDMNSKVSKGCGKVFYDEVEGAQKAVAELSGQLVNDRKITVEFLGQPTSKRHRRGPQQPEDQTDEAPRLLPLTFFTGAETLQAKLDLCYAAYEDLIDNHDEIATGHSLIWRLRGLTKEVNDVLISDSEAKQAFARLLKRHPWFDANAQQVKYQASRDRINISKISPLTPQYQAFYAEQRRVDAMDGDQDGGDDGMGKGKGKVTPPPAWQMAKWKEQAEAAMGGAMSGSSVALPGTLPKGAWSGGPAVTLPGAASRPQNIWGFQPSGW